MEMSNRPLRPMANATCTGSGCDCNSGGQEADSTVCSGGKNNGSICLTCTEGNPVNPANGNKIERQSVYRGLNGFELTLVFNAYDQFRLRFGWHWRDSFNRSVAIENGKAIAYRPDAKTLAFTSSGGLWAADAGTADRLVQTTSPAGWQFLAANGDEVETYDASGKLLTIKSRSGLTQTLAYSDGTNGPNGGAYLDANGNPTNFTLAAGYLIRASDHFGRLITFGYDNAGRIVKVTDPAGGVYRFAYVANNQLSTITFPDNKVVSYVYNEPADVDALVRGVERAKVMFR